MAGARSRHAGDPQPVRGGPRCRTAAAPWGGHLRPPGDAGGRGGRRLCPERHQRAGRQRGVAPRQYAGAQPLLRPPGPVGIRGPGAGASRRYAGVRRQHGQRAHHSAPPALRDLRRRPGRSGAVPGARRSPAARGHRAGRPAGRLGAGYRRPDDAAGRAASRRGHAGPVASGVGRAGERGVAGHVPGRAAGPDRGLCRRRGGRLGAGRVLAEEPSAAAPAIAVLASETGVDVLGSFGEFELVRLPDTRTGWVALGATVASRP
jgi:hypothetical protein